MNWKLLHRKVNGKGFDLVEKRQRKTLSSGGLSNEVYDKVKQMIITRELQPGEQIRQIQLAEELNVSRTPLINALQRLVSENYVQYQPRCGYVVRKFGYEEMVQLHRVREACEGVAAYDACDRITDEEIRELRSLFDPFLQIADWGPEALKKYLEADLRFHLKVTEISGNPFIMQALDNLGILYFTYQWGLLQFPEVSMKGHLKIIDCLGARDHEAARNAMEKHLMKGRKNIAYYYGRTPVDYCDKEMEIGG